MRIVKQKPRELKVRKLPFKWWLVGSIPIMLSLFTVNTFAKVTSLSCRRPELVQENCRLVASGLLGRTIREIPLNSLLGAKLDKNVDSYGVIIQTNKGDIPFTSYQSDATRDNVQLEIASSISNFISNPQERYLKVEQDDTWLIFTAGVSFVFGLFLMTSVGEIETFLFDKNLGLFILKKQGMFTAYVVEYNIWDIEDVRVQEKDNNYRINIVLASGHIIPFTSQYTPGKESKEKIALSIRQFLNINNYRVAELQKIIL